MIIKKSRLGRSEWKHFSPLTLRIILSIGETFFRLKGMRRKIGQDIGLLQAKRILVVRLDEIGDVILTTPLLRELRANAPQAWITLVVKSEVYNIMETCPYVDEIIAYDRDPKRKFHYLVRNFRALRIAAIYLWNKRFDIAILPNWDRDLYNGSLLTYLSGAEKRVAYSEYVSLEKHADNTDYDKLFTHLLTDNRLKHDVERNLDILRFLGGEARNDHTEVWPDVKDDASAKAILKDHDLDGESLLIGIGPWAKAPKRVWPLERFAELIAWIVKAADCKVVILGTKEEVEAGAYLESKCFGRAVNIIGRTTIRQTAAILKRCRLYIGNDTGLMHLAAAVKVRVVEISSWPNLGNRSSANSPYRFGPWGTDNVVVSPAKPTEPCSGECKSIDAHCILGVSLDDVKEAVQKLLSVPGDYGKEPV